MKVTGQVGFISANIHLMAECRASEMGDMRAKEQSARTGIVGYSHGFMFLDKYCLAEEMLMGYELNRLE